MQFAPLYPIVYRILQPRFPNCLWTGSPNSRRIALTFDDGPHRDYTPQLLKVLDYYQVTANFFWLGYLVEQLPSLAREIYERGHWVGIHGYYHQSFPCLSQEVLQESLAKTQSVIAQACQLKPESIRDVRPPNGLFTPKILALLQKWHYRIVMWSVVAEDWKSPGVDVVKQRVLNQVQNGSLIVLHDGYHGGGDVAKTTRELIPQLLQLGYHLVTIDELWLNLRE